MSRDEAREILGEGATEEQITNLLNKFHSSEKAKNEEITSLKNQLGKYGDYDNLKSQLDEINKEKMTEKEKLEAREKAIAEKEKEINITYNTAKAKEILAGEAVSEKILSKLVGGTLEETIELATIYKESIAALKDTTAKETRESLANVDLKPSISNVNQNEDVMNFEKFSKMSAEEQEKFINEHPEEFEKL